MTRALDFFDTHIVPVIVARGDGKDARLAGRPTKQRIEERPILLCIRDAVVLSALRRSGLVVVETRIRPLPPLATVVAPLQRAAGLVRHTADVWRDGVFSLGSEVGVHRYVHKDKRWWELPPVALRRKGKRERGGTASEKHRDDGIPSIFISPPSLLSRCGPTARRLHRPSRRLPSIPVT